MRDDDDTTTDTELLKWWRRLSIAQQLELASREWQIIIDRTAGQQTDQ